MGLFSFYQDLAIDLGTANTLIMHNGKVVVDEPSIVALSIKTGDLMAIGHKARLMDGKTHSNIRTACGHRRNVTEERFAEYVKRGGIIGLNLCDAFIVDDPKAEAANYDAGGAEPEGHIHLSEMLELGIKRLTDKKPFFIMCEGGEIDWSAHAQKTMPTIFSIIEFDKAIQVAYDFYEKHPKETLIIITADHGTGGVSFSEDPDWESMEKIWTMFARMLLH